METHYTIQEKKLEGRYVKSVVKMLLNYDQMEFMATDYEDEYFHMLDAGATMGICLSFNLIAHKNEGYIKIIANRGNTAKAKSKLESLLKAKLLFKGRR